MPSSRMISSTRWQELCGADPEIAALRHGIDGVDYHGQHHLLDLGGIAVDMGQFLAQIELS